MIGPVIGVLFDGFAYGMLLFLLSVGLSVTLGMMNFVNLAHCAFAMLGGYVTVTLMNSFGWPFFATLPFAFLAAALLSVVFERVLYRRLYRASDLDQVLLTIGLAFVSVAVAAYVYGTIQQPVQMPSYLRGSVTIFGLSFGAYRLFLVAISLVVTLLLVAALEYTRFGAQVRAAVDNQRMARGLGINVDGAFAITFALGSGLAGLGGALAIEIVGLDPSFAFTYLIYVLIVVSVGGLGSIAGSFAAATLIGISDVAGKYYVPELGAFLIYLVMIVLLDVAASWLVREAVMSVIRHCAHTPRAYLERQSRWSWIEFVFWLATLLPFWLTPDYLVLASQIAITALFALSLDLILGYAGIVSLGHAAFFGLGAYAAGLFSKFVWGEPLSGLILGGLVAGIVGYAASFIVARFRHLALIMITLGMGLLLHEAANSASWLTGGADGLQGVKIWPIFNTFRFDLYGKTAYAYSLIVLFLTFLVARRIINSPFGLSLRGIRENSLRMPALGAPSHAHIRKIYTISAVMAGHRGRAARADHRNGLARSARLPALRRRAGDADPRRRGTPLWRARRRDHLHGGARLVLRQHAAVLVFLDRHALDPRRDVPAERHPRRAREAHRSWRRT